MQHRDVDEPFWVKQIIESDWIRFELIYCNGEFSTDVQKWIKLTDSLLLKLIKLFSILDGQIKMHENVHYQINYFQIYCGYNTAQH